MIFDSHAHYDDEAFDDDREELLSSMEKAGVGTIVNVAADLKSVETTLALAQKWPALYAALGVHPSFAGELDEPSFRWLWEKLEEEKVVAVGEIGLDYYWDKEPKVRDRQKYWFARQLELARETDLPVIIHSRDAAKDTLEVLQEKRAQELKGVMHCFSYTKETAEKILDWGWYFGIGGVLTFKNGKKLREAVEIIPLDRILLETDCPYLAPEPNRGKRNDSRNLAYVVSALAGLKGVSEEEAIEITQQNLFPLLCERGREADTGGGFAHAALLIDHCNNFCHLDTDLPCLQGKTRFRRGLRIRYGVIIALLYAINKEKAEENPKNDRNCFT